MNEEATQAAQDLAVDLDSALSNAWIWLSARAEDESFDVKRATDLINDLLALQLVILEDLGN